MSIRRSGPLGHRVQTVPSFERLQQVGPRTSVAQGTGIDIAADREFLDQSQVRQRVPISIRAAAAVSRSVASPLHPTLIGKTSIGKVQQRRCRLHSLEQRDAFSGGDAQVDRFKATLNADLLHCQLSGQRILPSSRPTVSIMT